MFEIGSFERADGVVFGESGEHLGRNEGRGEEGIGCGCGGYGGVAVRSGGRHGGACSCPAFLVLVLVPVVVVALRRSVEVPSGLVVTCS